MSALQNLDKIARAKTGTALPVIRSKLLDSAGISHAFFTRQGGVSQGIYASLNGGVGSNDAPETVAANRRLMAQALGIAAEDLFVAYQIHSADAVLVTEPWTERPRCDGLVTKTKGTGLGATGADCGMILFADPDAGVVASAHAGWRGAFTGVIEATVSQMIAAGASRKRIAAALGPAIGPESYEVGPEFFERFVAVDQTFAKFFGAGKRTGHKMFDLPGFIGLQMERAGIKDFENLALDTYTDEERFFSYRRSVHRKEPDYGRQISAIALV